MARRTILVTGAAGFVGSVLVRELARHGGCRLLGLDNLSRSGSALNVPLLQQAGCEFIHGDIRDAELLDRLPRVDWVVDCAANPSVLAGVGDSSSFAVMDHNLIGTLRMLEYCRKHGAGFILLSTSRVYSIPVLANLPLKTVGEAYQPDPAAPWPAGLSAGGIGEDFSTAPPLSLYGMSKLCSEQVALEYGQAFGFPVWINRCGVLAGAGQFGRADQGIFSYWIHSWRAGRRLRYIGFDGRGRQVRDCLHPRDLVPLLRRQMEEPTRDVERVQNVAGGVRQAMSLRELSLWCERRLGARSVESDPQPRPFDVPWVVLDSGRARAQWGWEPQTSLEEILEEIARHAEAHPEWLEVSAA